MVIPERCIAPKIKRLTQRQFSQANLTERNTDHYRERHPMPFKDSAHVHRQNLNIINERYIVFTSDRVVGYSVTLASCRVSTLT